MSLRSTKSGVYNITASFLQSSTALRKPSNCRALRLNQWWLHASLSTATSWHPGNQ